MGRAAQGKPGQCRRVFAELLPLYRTEPSARGFGGCARGVSLVELSLAWLGEADALVADHALYQQLGRDDASRQHAYRQLFSGHLPSLTLHVMREALTHNYPLSNNRFRDSVERQLGRVVGQCSRGRPVVDNKSLRPL